MQYIKEMKAQIIFYAITVIVVLTCTVAAKHISESSLLTVNEAARIANEQYGCGDKDDIYGYYDYLVYRNTLRKNNKVYHNFYLERFLGDHVSYQTSISVDARNGRCFDSTYFETCKNSPRPQVCAKIPSLEDIEEKTIEDINRSLEDCYEYEIVDVWSSPDFSFPEIHCDVWGLYNRKSIALCFDDKGIFVSAEMFY